MDGVGPIVVVLAVLVAVAIVLGLLRDRSLARRIGGEVAGAGRGGDDGSARSATDPIHLLSELDRLRRSGAITDEEFAQQKARILGAGSASPDADSPAS